MRDVGYETFNLYMNLGTLAFLVCLYLIKVIFTLLFIKPLSMIFERVKDMYTKMYYQVFWSDLIVILKEGYMEFLISSFLL